MLKLLVVAIFVLVTHARQWEDWEDEVNSVIEQNPTGKHWALLVAGSNGWYNYRHQVGGLLKGNIAELTYILFMYQFLDTSRNQSSFPKP